jgi:hypothetical protein
MQSLMVIEIEVALKPQHRFRDMLIIMKINLFILHAPPETFDKDIVERSPTSIHTDLNVVLQQTPGEGGRCKLRALIGVEYFWSAECQGTIKSTQTVLAIERDRDFPAHHIA